MKTAFLASICLVPVLAAHAGVYDDTAAWWHLDYDPDHTPGALNAAQINDIRDQRNWASTSGPGYPTNIGGEDGGPLWTNAPVVCPAGGQAYGMSLLFRQITNENHQIKQDTIQFGGLKLGGSSTIVTRFRWDGRFFGAGNPDWIYNNSLDWNLRLGWMFGVRHNSGHRLGMFVGQTEIQGPSVESNKWYDAAAVLTDNGPDNTDTVELFLWPEGGTLQYTKETTFAVTNGVGGWGGIIGCEAGPSADYSSSTNGNAIKCFKGLVNHIALWDRALSHDEVLEAFCFPQPLFQVGIKNSEALDMRTENETDAVFNAGDPWHTMPRAVTTTRRAVTLNIPVTAVQTNCNYVFHLKTATSDGSRSAKLRLSVNGQSNPVRETLRVHPQQDYFWPVAKERLIAGTNTFTLTYVDGPAPWITFDWIELGGAWQIGLDDNNAGSDFEEENKLGDHFYITDTNWKHLERAIVRGADSNTVLHFALSPEMVTNVNFSYTTRIVSQGAPTGAEPRPPYPFSIEVNDNVLYETDGVQDNTLVTFPLDASVLRGGMNDINLMFGSSTNGWIQFDFHRLDSIPWVLPDRSGTTLLMQ